MAERPEMRGDLGEQAGEGDLQLPQALARDAARVAIEAVVGAIDDSQQQLNEAAERRRSAAESIVLRQRRDEDGGGGDEELVLEGKGVAGGLNDGAEGIEEAEQERRRRRRRRIFERVVLEESEDVELELDGNVLANEGGEAEVRHRCTARKAVEAGGAVEIEFVD